jgi:hypothetical protein
MRCFLLAALVFAAAPPTTSYGQGSGQNSPRAFQPTEEQKRSLSKLTNEEKRYSIATLMLLQCVLVAPQFTKADHSTMERVSSSTTDDARFVDRQVGMVVNVTREQCTVAVVGRDVEKVAQGVVPVLKSRDQAARLAAKGGVFLGEFVAAGKAIMVAVRPFETPFGPSVAMAMRLK